MAIVSCIGLSCAYVGVLYLVPKKIRELPRDAPEHIWFRSLYIILLCLATAFFLPLNFYPRESLSTICYCVLLTITLFTGPLIHLGLQWHHDLLPAPYLGQSRAMLCRVFIVGPISEEWIFRGCMVPLLLQDNMSETAIIFGSPFLFGIAHLHHAIEHIRKGKSVQQALCIVLFQLGYTTIFGAYVCFLYLRTQSLVSIVLIHMFCNFIGFPDTSFAQTYDPMYKYATVIWISYVIGIGLFLSRLFDV